MWGQRRHYFQVAWILYSWSVSIFNSATAEILITASHSTWVQSRDLIITTVYVVVVASSTSVLLSAHVSRACAASGWPPPAMALVLGTPLGRVRRRARLSTGRSRETPPGATGEPRFVRPHASLLRSHIRGTRTHSALFLIIQTTYIWSIQCIPIQAVNFYSSSSNIRCF